MQYLSNSGLNQNLQENTIQSFVYRTLFIPLSLPINHLPTPGLSESYLWKPPDWHTYSTVTAPKISSTSSTTVKQSIIKLTFLCTDTLHRTLNVWLNWTGIFCCRVPEYFCVCVRGKHCKPETTRWNVVLFLLSFVILGNWPFNTMCISHNFQNMITRDIQESVTSLSERPNGTEGSDTLVN